MSLLVPDMSNDQGRQVMGACWQCRLHCGAAQTGESHGGSGVSLNRPGALIWSSTDYLE